MEYQLVLQFDALESEDFDRLIEIEDRLGRVLGNEHNVDGHDFGSGEMNIFILSNQPSAAFDLIKDNLAASEANTMKAAFRESNGETYSILWPENYSGEFLIV